MSSYLRTAGLAAVALNLIVAIVAMAAFPQVLGSERNTFIVADGLILLAYATWLMFGPDARLRSILLGAAAALVQFADITREYFTAWPTWLLLIAMLITLALFAAAGFGLTLAPAVAQGAYAAITTMLVLWVLAWALDAAAPGPIGSALSSDPDYRRSGLGDIHSYIVWNTLSAAFSHAILLPLFGLAAGAGGSAIWRAARMERLVRDGS